MSLDTTKRIVSVRYNDADIPVGAALPELTNPADTSNVDSGKEFISGSGEKLVGTSEKIDTSDAFVYAWDIAKGRTAYAYGMKLTGTLEDEGTKTIRLAGEHFPQLDDSDSIAFIGKHNKECIVRKCDFNLDIPRADLGDATAADVASGKTFTSAAGLKVTGTMTVPLIRYFNGRVDAQQAGGAVVFNIPVLLRGTGTIKIYGNINYGASATIAFSNNGSQNKAFANARSADASTAYSSALGQLSISYPTDLYGVSGGVDCNFVVIEI